MAVGDVAYLISLVYFMGEGSVVIPKYGSNRAVIADGRNVIPASNGVQPYVDSTKMGRV